MIFWVFDHPKSEGVAAPCLKPLVSIKATTFWARQSFALCSINSAPDHSKPVVFKQDKHVCEFKNVSKGKDKRELKMMFVWTIGVGEL